VPSLKLQGAWMLKLIIVALMGIGFSLTFLIFLPFLAIFFELAWNATMSYLHLSGNEISYWQALKLSFFIFMAKALLSGSVSVQGKG